VSIRDGLIAVYKDRKVRVRISGDIATIAVKGPRIGIGRLEFEYEIPVKRRSVRPRRELSREPAWIEQQCVLRSFASAK
jgi:hypothetical protein